MTMSSAERQRLYRRRLQRGEAVYPVVTGEQVFTALCGAGLLADSDADDREKVARALATALAEWASAKEAENILLCATRDRLGLRYDSQ